MMGRWHRSHHADPRPPEDGVVGGLNVKDTEFCDDVEKVDMNWELDGVGGAGFAPVKTIEE